MAEIFAVKHGVTGYVAVTGPKGQYRHLQLQGIDEHGVGFEIHLNSSGPLMVILEALEATGAISIHLKRQDSPNAG